MTNASRRPASLAQLAVLRALAHQSPTSMTGMVERTGMNRSWLSRTIGLLAQQGYVSRRPSRTDARRIEVVITRQGRALLAAQKVGAIK